MPITDPTDPLKSFQSEFEREPLKLHRGELDANLWVHVDHSRRRSVVERGLSKLTSALWRALRDCADHWRLAVRG